MGSKQRIGIKSANQEVEFTREMIEEMMKCAVDPVYFIKNYVYIKHPIRGRMKFDLYPYQEKMIRKYQTQQFCISVLARQSGKTSSANAFLLWESIFVKEWTILIASNKSANAMRIIEEIQYSYEELPNWIKPGVKDTYNKHEIYFDNESKIISTATSKDSGRGFPISRIYVDEYGFIAPHIQEEFWSAILPTISSGGKMIVTSTPNGDVGKFAELWRGAIAGTNDFKDGVTHVKWNETPGRDEAFRQKYIGLLGMRKWLQEYETEFLSEELTLVDGAIITQREALIQLKIAENDLIKFAVNDNKFEFYKKLMKDATYILGVDPCSGVGTDNGVIQVFEFPSMEQVMEYSNNTLSPHVMYTELKSIINFLRRATDEIYFSIENNGVGQGILAAYEGDMNPPEAQLISHQGKDKTGVNSNVKTKLRACLQFKDAFERGKITINSQKLLTELKSFVRSAGSYAAQIGATDDRIMGCIVVFYIIQEMSANNANAYDMVYTVAEEIEKRHGWEVQSELIETQTDAGGRSAALTALFKTLHGDPDNRGGYR